VIRSVERFSKRGSVRHGDDAASLLIPWASASCAKEYAHALKRESVFSMTGIARTEAA
jgi:hypothetical protein